LNQRAGSALSSTNIFRSHKTQAEIKKKINSSFTSIFKPIFIQRRYIRTISEDQSNTATIKEEKFDADMLYTLGNELMTQSRYSEAIEVYERLFEKHKQLSPDVLLNVFNTLASLYATVDRNEDSAKLFSRLIEIRAGQSAMDMVKQAREYRLEKQYDKEYICLRRMATVFAEITKEPLLEVFKANVDGDHEEVLKLVAKVPEESIPPQMWDMIGQAQLHLGKHEEALKSADKALEKAQGEEWEEMKRPFVNTKVKALIRLGKLEEAMNANEDQDANYFMTHLSLGEIAYASGEFEDALECYNMAIELHEQVEMDVHRYKSYLLKATALDAKGDLQEAINAYEYVLWIKPDEQVSMERLGALYLDVDRIDKAKEMLEKLIELRPNDPKLLSKMEYVKARTKKSNQ
jgi:tetratricopeptide (TPR) repeat protein